jgi:hypothetical protein
MPVKTQEFAKNANAVVTVQCSGCKTEYQIAEMLKEEPLPHPHVTVVEGFLECPKCKARVHSYYMTETLRHDQVQLKKAILEWQRTKATPAWREYERRQKVFQANYDRVQARYKELLQEESSHEPDNT